MSRMVEHFKSKKAYDKYEAYIHIHDIPHKHHDKVIIDGHAHKVKAPHNEGYCLHCGNLHY